MCIVVFFLAEGAFIGLYNFPPDIYFVQKKKKKFCTLKFHDQTFLKLCDFRKAPACNM